MIRDITWASGAPLPVAMKGHAHGAIRTSVLLYGGTQFESVTPEAVRKGTVTLMGRKGWRLDTRMGTYHSLPDAPVGVKWAGHAVVDEAFYLLTGTMPDNAVSPRMFRLSRSSAAFDWHEMPAMQTGRFIPGIAVIDKTIYVVGGEAVLPSVAPSPTTQTTVDVMETFDTANPDRGWERAPALPGLAREGMAIAAVGRTLYVFGGLHMLPSAATAAPASDADPYRLCADAYAFDADREVWRRLPDPPFPCYGWQASVWANRFVILAAGLSSRQPPERLQRPNDRVVVFDTISMRYCELPTPLPLPSLLPTSTGMADGYSDLGQRERAEKYVAVVRESSKTIDLRHGGFRISPGLSLIGNSLYMTGGECLTPDACASDDVLVGALVADEETAR
jgi:hypothetical protein